LDDDFEYHALENTLIILPFNKKTSYTITEIISANGNKHRLMEVPFYPEGVCEERITLAIHAVVPSRERLYLGACFVYSRTHSEGSFQAASLFSLEASNLGCLGFGLAPTPKIHSAPLRNFEILISKARFGETAVDLMLSFECPIEFFAYDSDSDNHSVVEIDLPESWSYIGIMVQPVTMRCTYVDGIFSDLEAELREFCHTKISVEIKPHLSRQRKIFVKQNTKCSIVVSGVTLPSPPLDLHDAWLMVVDANNQVAQEGQSQADYEQHRRDLDDAISKLNAWSDFFTSGCNVTIKDAQARAVMTGRNVPMSPLLEREQYAAVIERKTFENSEFLRAHDGPAGIMPLNRHEVEFSIKLMQFIEAFVAQKYQGNASIINSDKTRSAIDKYYSQVSVELHRRHRNQIDAEDVEASMALRVSTFYYQCLLLLCSLQHSYGRLMFLSNWTINIYIFIKLSIGLHS
jgi:hypothetical protein